MKLTVAILTYKRAHDFEECLQSVIANITSSNQQQVEILIADNEPGETETKKVAKRFQENYSSYFINYYQHEQNIGYDANVNFAVKTAKAGHVWIFSDDDAILPGAVDYVLSILCSYPQLAVMFVNYKNSRAVLNRSEFVPVSPPSESENIVCTSTQEFLKQSEFLFTLVSSLIVNKQQWLKCFRQEYIGTAWIHIAMVLSILSISHESLVVRTKLFLFRMLNPGDENFWCYGEKQYFVPAKLYKLFQMMVLSSNEPAIYQSLMDDHYRAILVILLCVVRDGADLQVRYKIARDLLANYSGKLRTWMLYLPILLIPSIVLKLCYRFYKTFIKEKNLVL